MQKSKMTSVGSIESNNDTSIISFNEKWSVTPERNRSDNIDPKESDKKHMIIYMLSCIFK